MSCLARLVAGARLGWWLVTLATRPEQTNRIIELALRLTDEPDPGG
jgi:hypothetical protein